MRGKEGSVEHERNHYRITPACAGKRTITILCQKCGKDHPRVCGEKFDFAYGGDLRKGSPPRVRGKDLLFRASAKSDRITPACAGKSAALTTTITEIEDHPRVCGEKAAFAVVVCMAQGSPPRVRGKGFLSLKILLEHRITPACAGKSVKLLNC